MTFAETLKKHRKKAGMTQAQLAEKVGLSLGAIGNYESGKRENISTAIIVRLADALNVPYEEFGLIERTDPEQKFLLNIQWHEEMKNHADLLNAYDVLNADGQREAVKRVQELGEINRYRKA